MYHVGQICRWLIPAQVEYSITYIVKGCAEVYVGDADLVESLSVSLNATLNKEQSGLHGHRSLRGTREHAYWYQMRLSAQQERCPRSSSAIGAGGAVGGATGCSKRG
jgi:hypothetical protein